MNVKGVLLRTGAAIALLMASCQTQQGIAPSPVTEGDDIVGVVSNFDFLKCFAFNPGRMVPAYDDLLSRMVVDVMTPEFIYVDPVTKLTRVLQLMVDHRMKSLPVLDAEQRLVGIIAREDIMRALTESTRG